MKTMNRYIFSGEKVFHHVLEGFVKIETEMEWLWGNCRTKFFLESLSLRTKKVLVWKIYTEK